MESEAGRFIHDLVEGAGIGFSLNLSLFSSHVENQELLKKFLPKDVRAKKLAILIKTGEAMIENAQTTYEQTMDDLRKFLQKTYVQAKRSQSDFKKSHSLYTASSLKEKLDDLEKSLEEAQKWNDETMKLVEGVFVPYVAKTQMLLERLRTL